MAIQLSPEQEHVLEQAVEAGRFASVEEGLARAIEMISFDEFDPEDLAAIQEGLDQADRGETIPLEEVRAQLNKELGLGL